MGVVFEYYALSREVLEFVLQYLEAGNEGSDARTPLQDLLRTKWESLL